MPGLSVILLGNGPFAVPLLDSLSASRHRVLQVVTRPDRPQGKSMQIILGPVARRAEELGLTTFQPESANDPAVIDHLREVNADILVVADFGQILSEACLSAARLGGINVHGSLLPKYRGAAPIAWAIYHGEAETGVSIIQMTRGLDAGGVICQRAIPIGPKETAGELEARLALLGGELAVHALDLLEQGTATPVPQDLALVTKAPRLQKTDGAIDWSRSAQAIHDQIRAMQPWPVAYTDLLRPDGSALRLQVLASEVDPAASSGGEPGQVVEAKGGRLRVATGEGILALTRLKPAGKKEMDAGSFINGQRLVGGERFAPQLD